MKIYRAKDISKEEVTSILLERGTDSNKQYEDAVFKIVNDVKENGDAALLSYTKQFDKADLTPETMKVTKEEIEDAYTRVDPELIRVIRKSRDNIADFHRKQIRNSWFTTTSEGTFLGQKIIPMQRAGVYVPGGKAFYPSSVLMNVIPAKEAGVKEIVMMTPSDAEGRIAPAVLVTADIAGADVIFKSGGAQAIAAMAFGTKTIPRVDKIVGPGNIYVALAKKAVYGNVSIDSIAGPSEILVIADASANPRFVAADLMSQAEHDEMASAILVTTDEALAEKVLEEIIGFMKVLSRKDILEKSLNSHSFTIVTETLDEACEYANEIAPEHLEIVTENPFELMTKITNAGAIFLGEYSSEPLGDYFAGPNHILPTSGTARFFSALSVDDFVKKSSVIYYSKDALKAVHKDIEAFALSEKLDGHANSIKVRFEGEE